MKHIDIDGGRISMSFKILIPILSSIVVGALWTQSTLYKMDARSERIERALTHAWTVDEHVDFTHRLSDMNPTLKIPYIPDIIRGTQSGRP